MGTNDFTTMLGMGVGFIIALCMICSIAFTIYIFYHGIFGTLEKFKIKGYNKIILKLYPLFCCCSFALCVYTIVAHILK